MKRRIPKGIDELTIIIDLIRAEIAKSSHPAPCSRIASLVTEQHATIANDWNGMGSFRKLVELGSGEDDARTLSRKTIENLRSLCQREQIVIDHDIDDALNRWINRGT